MSRPAVACPGCGLELPSNGWRGDLRVLASTECWELYGEIQAATIGDASLGRFRQLTVDTYLAQHASERSSSIGVAFALLGLHLSLELGRSGAEVRAEHRRLAETPRTWPVFVAPADRGRRTVFDVAIADAAERPAAIEAWSRSVWDAWSDWHPTVRALLAGAAP